MDSAPANKKRGRTNLSHSPSSAIAEELTEFALVGDPDDPDSQLRIGDLEGEDLGDEGEPTNPDGEPWFPGDAVATVESIKAQAA
mmetsp:Transcript_68008/g.102577  ORF Transcript_68008/g.102577 Transcript_68008/m.102577 type:complete len:85 (-) Transcript_68008:603-857(-)